eukprot:CAMPEP_0178954304 /NCGR_PEP_ID=MMETSP0789-20121207/8910_1 /TAXON_ID=3005 /ORGANISM="Rhizosolenia setigera, Strain CCMP 1694" /LENGTH=317 /DNA_ID=CAMNT_0020635679 /DNA_START=113 /DNA_END=1066 /DNA_ORIENTATION=+
MTLFSLPKKQNAATATLLFTMMTSLLTFTQHNTHAFLLPSTSTTSITTSTTTLKNGVTPHENELSRIFETDIFTSSAKTTTSRIRKNREIPFQVEATVNECEALCKRFKLPAIHKLKADLFLKKSDYSHINGNGIQVKGQVESTLTQTCVRTNEDFQVDLDFDLFAIVKPMSSRGVGFTDNDNIEDENNDDELAAFLTSQIDTPSKTNKKRNNNNKGGGRRNTRNNQRNKRLTSSSSSGEMSTIDMEELQNFFNDMEGDANNNNMMDSLEEDLIEDYAVYHDDVLDIGELVAQMFRMKLDPYPKKPGSQPIQMSITG